MRKQRATALDRAIAKLDDDIKALMVSHDEEIKVLVMARERLQAQQPTRLRIDDTANVDDAKVDR